MKVEIPGSYPGITRVHIITPGDSPNKEYWADEWEAHIQDGGKTLKLFAKGTGASARAQRNTSLAKDFTDLQKLVPRLVAKFRGRE
jgi:hypothetical protein